MTTIYREAHEYLRQQVDNPKEYEAAAKVLTAMSYAYCDYHAVALALCARLITTVDDLDKRIALLEAAK